jgi:NAD(P)-dependent dehydrogenase (short-subunit alcohol dehydrogenase family)
MLLKGKIAVVTGAGRGIGWAIAEAMVGAGASVIAIDAVRRKENELSGHSERKRKSIIFKQLDVTRSEEVKGLVNAMFQKHGRIDILVNNAGLGQMEDFNSGNEMRWGRLIDVNLKGVLYFCRAVAEQMMARKSGKIINIASTSGLVGSGHQVVYSATKGAVISLTRSLAQEMAPYHINVNAICPGFVETPFTLKGRELMPDYFDKMVAAIPWGRAGQPEDIAKVAVFLASEGSEYITGQCIVVDGGQSRV